MSLKLIYISDTEGSIYQINLTTKTQRILLRKEQLGGLAVGLSVDWLYNRLYIVLRTRDWQIGSCDLMGNDFSLVIGALPDFPQNIQADPYNG